MKQRTHQMPMLSRAATVQPGSLDEEARTVDLVFTTGARVLRYGWRGSYQEELSLDPKHVRLGRLNGGAPLLDSHKGWGLSGVMGVVVGGSARLEKGQGVATVRFAKAEDDPEADKVYRKVKDGIIRNVSVGYRVHKMTKVEEGEGQIPVMRAEDWEPMEISLVPMGADPAAGVRAAGAETNPCEFVEDEPPEEKRMSIKNDPQGGTPAPVTAEPAVDAERVAKEAREAERKRAAEIRRVAAGLKLPEEFAARHIEQGTELDAFRAAAIDERAKEVIVTGPALRVEAGEDARDKYVRGVSDWLLIRAALATAVEDAGKRKGETVKLDPGEFRGMTFVELARMSLERAGVSTRGWDKRKILGEALVQRGGLHSTGDFSTALENVMHKTLLAAYAITPDTWSRFCKKGSVSDFRAHPRYRMGTFATLSTVLEGGEIPNLALADAKKESLTAATKGGMVGISRQALINDDMGVFNDVGMKIGRAAKLTIEKDVYATLALNSGLGPSMADGQTLFHATHNNIGTGAALSMAAIDADRVVMAKQQDPSNNEYLDLRPAILLVPVELGGDARTINDAQYDPDTANKLQKPNKVRGLFRDIVESARMPNTTRRYLLADPSVAPTLEVAFLDGIEEPYLELKEGWRVDGVEWKVREDYAVGAVDFRGAVTNAGA